MGRSWAGTGNERESCFCFVLPLPEFMRGACSGLDVCWTRVQMTGRSRLHPRGVQAALTLLCVDLRCRNRESAQWPRGVCFGDWATLRKSCFLGDPQASRVKCTESCIFYKGMCGSEQCIWVCNIETNIETSYNFPLYIFAAPLDEAPHSPSNWLGGALEDGTSTCALTMKQKW